MPGTVITPAFQRALTRTQSQVIRILPEAPSAWSWRSWTWPAAGALALGAVAFFQPWQVLHSEPAPVQGSAHTSPTHGAIRQVNVVHPTAVTTSSVVLPATIRPRQVTTLNARVSGYLKSWHIELGSKVKAGQLLAEIETPELDQEVAEGQAQADEANAAAVQAKALRVEAEAELKVTLAQLARIEAETELARTQLARREKLLVSKAIAQDEFDTFQKQYEARVADVRAAHAEVARKRTSLDTHAAVIAAREATASSKRANVERLKELQSFQRITAPFDGVVTQRTAEVGMLVTAGKEPLFVVEDLSRVRVQVNVPQANAAQTKVGADASIIVPESHQPAIAAQVTRIANSVDVTSRTMVAEIELDNQTLHLQPGSYAQVTIATAQAGAAWTIPANTLQMRVEGPHVAVVTESNQVELRPVTLGRDLGGRVVVSAGIHGDERLVVNPTDDLHSGANVQVGPRS